MSGSVTGKQCRAQAAAILYLNTQQLKPNYGGVCNTCSGTCLLQDGRRGGGTAGAEQDDGSNISINTWLKEKKEGRLNGQGQQKVPKKKGTNERLGLEGLSGNIGPR
jgi:hypothetical protein